MSPKLLLVIVLMTFQFHSIQNELQTFQGVFRQPEMKPRSEIKKDMKEATISKEFLPISKESVSVEDQEDISSEEMIPMRDNEEQMKIRRSKRETGFGDITITARSNKSRRERREIQNTKVQGVEISKQASPPETDKLKKRQTSIKGNGNRLSNLINLPIRLNVLANVLSQLNRGVIDPKAKPLTSNSISGNDNTVSSLINAPIDVDAIVNVLSKVDRGNVSSSDAGNNKDDLVGGVLGSLLGGDAGKGEKGLVDGLLGGLLGDGNGVSGLLENVLGDTLGDLLSALLGNDGLVGNLLGDGVNGKDFITGLLDDLLGGVEDLVDNLLELLVGVLEGLLHGLGTSNGDAVVVAEAIEPSHSAAGSPRLNIHGNSNSVSSLINAPVRVNALINALSSLKQEIRQQVNPAVVSGKATNIHGNNNEISSLINLPADLDLKVNLLSSVVENPLAKASSGETKALLPALLGSLTSDSSASGSSLPAAASPSSAVDSGSSTNIKGNNNLLSSVLNVVPDVDLKLNLLSEITDLLGDSNDKNPTTNGIQEGNKNNNPNEICFDIPISQTDTSIIGDNNTISNAVNLKPKIHIDLNLLSDVKQTSDSNVPTQRVCITRVAQPSTRSTALPVVPHKPVTASPKSTPSKPTTPSLPVPPPTVPSSKSNSSNEICFDVLVDQSGTVVSGNNNQISSLINVEPKINLDLNLLSNIQKPNSAQGNLVVKRICIPRQTTPGPVSTAAPPAYYPRSTNTRCFRRTCTKWRQSVDYNCANKSNEYPKITYTMDI